MVKTSESIIFIIFIHFPYFTAASRWGPSVLTCPTYTSSLALRGLSSELSQNSELSSDETENWKSPGRETRRCTHEQNLTTSQENRQFLVPTPQISWRDSTVVLIFNQLATFMWKGEYKVHRKPHSGDQCSVCVWDWKALNFMIIDLQSTSVRLPSSWQLKGRVWQCELKVTCLHAC